MTNRLTFSVQPRDLADLEAQIDERIEQFINDDAVIWASEPESTWHVTTKEVFGGDGSRRLIAYEAEVEVVFR